MFQYREPQLNAYFSIGSLEDSFPAAGKQLIPNYTIILCLDGICDVDCDAERIDIGSSSAFTLSPGSLLEVHKSGGEAMFCIEFNREFYCVEYHDVEISCNGLLFNGAVQPPVIRIDDREREVLSLLIRMFEQESRNADRLQLEMLRALLKRLIITCARLVKQQLETDRNMRFEETDLLSSFSALVDKHFRRKHKVTEYAAMLNRSPKTLSNLFVRYSDRGALQVIHDRIALEARRMLLMTDSTAKEIAFELGFSDPAQFNRFIKKMTGHTTQELREAR